jgi:hypothetical protein
LEHVVEERHPDRRGESGERTCPSDGLVRGHLLTQPREDNRSDRDEDREDVWPGDVERRQIGEGDLNQRLGFHAE